MPYRDREEWDKGTVHFLGALSEETLGQGNAVSCWIKLSIGGMEEMVWVRDVGRSIGGWCFKLMMCLRWGKC